MTKRYVPQLRFKEFTKEYESVKLGKIAKFSKGKGISKSDIDSNGNIECIRYGELYTKYNEKIDEVDSRTSGNPNDFVLSVANDVITPSSGETAIDLATASYISKSGIALGGDINIIKTKQNGLYLAYYLNYKKRNDFARLAQGSSIIHIYNDHLKTLKLKLPSLDEQEKVANFLSKVDEKISLLEEKIDNLELFKNGFIQKFDNQIIDNFSKEKVKLKKLLINYTEKTTTNNQYEVLSSTLEGIKVQSSYFNHQTASDDTTGYKIVPKGYFTYRSMSDTGDFRFNIQDIVDKGIVSPAYPVFFTNEKIDSNFLHIILNYSSVIKRQLLRNLAGGTRYALPFSRLIEFSIFLPPMNIQRSIVEKVSLIEKKIGMQKNILENLAAFKKGLLQKMFI